jgi:hypothetical protein
MVIPAVEVRLVVDSATDQRSESRSKSLESGYKKSLKVNLPVSAMSMTLRFDELCDERVMTLNSFDPNWEPENPDC